MHIVRVRQHVNPLSRKFQGPIAPLDWTQIYRRPAQPLHLDIGSAKGQFLFGMAEAHPEWNFLGIEIRQPLVERTNRWCRERQLDNLHFVFGNANANLRSLITPQALQSVSIQFPDPWFKRRHQKRRVVQPQLVQDLAICLHDGGWVLLQSDVLEVAEEMRDRFSENNDFVIQGNGEWLPNNPLAIMTDREEVTLAKQQPVYRCQFKRRSGIYLKSDCPS